MLVLVQSKGAAKPALLSAGAAGPDHSKDRKIWYDTPHGCSPDPSTPTNFALWVSLIMHEERAPTVCFEAGSPSCICCP